MHIFLSIFLFILGAVVGSFLNVCIFRIPEGKSIVLPASHCMNCGTPIRFYDNIPIISYLILGGSCRNCGIKISPQYPAVEFLTGLACLTLYLTYDLTFSFLFTFLFTAALIVITVIDLRHQIIPHAVTLPGIPIFYLAAVFFMDISPVEGFLGIMIGAGCLYFVAIYYEALTGREGMGGGDINLIAMMGGFLGWKSLIYIILVSSFTGAIIGIALMILKKKDTKYAVPFGPFLSIGAVSYLFIGNSAFHFLYLF
ncbi:MAG: prepilin peptidase [Syntrophales bacterium]|jgi:leader peptidase (prepilin peptidase)/N-methyltransferase|nr:prepilin peptidase [Syntrophales bacterium]MDY0045155.1 prepilin peptidase [Syntrophales bacterium]